MAIRRFSWWAIAAIGLFVLELATRTRTASISGAFPDVVLWAWESKQDLRFIQPNTTAVAFLERTVWLHPQGVRVVPRSQGLSFPPGTPLIATVRMEMPKSRTALLPPAREAAAAVVAASKANGVAALQIDFDARLSERKWYADFLRELRSATPPNVPITITALESWCEEERSWLRALPVAEATPMLFRMGLDERRAPLRFPTAICESSVGVSTDELPSRIPQGPRRIYIFHPGAWTEPDYLAAMQRVKEWRAKQ